MRVNASALHAALDGIQDAALQPERWLETIEAISRASGAMGANIMEPTGRGALGGVIITDSLSKVMDEYYREEWSLRDHRAQFIPLIHRRHVILEKDMASREEIERLDYYKFLAKHRMRHTAIMDISAAGDEMFLVLQKEIGEGPFDGEDMPHFHAIRSRFLSGVQLARHLSGARRHGMATAFETARIGCIFFDRNGRVALANPKAEKLLSEDVRIVNGSIKALYPAETRAFHTMLSSVTEGTLSTERSAGDLVSLSRNGKRPLIIRFEKAGGQISDLFGHSGAMALIEDPEEERQESPEKLAMLFGLTPAEARISLSLTRGTGAVDIAAQSGLAYETVRSHIRSIFRKTGTGRQSELSALFSKIRL